MAATVRILTKTTAHESFDGTSASIHVIGSGQQSEEGPVVFTLQEIEAAIAVLPHEDFMKLREWFAEHASDRWDEQIANDVRDGKLDRLAEKALEDHRLGRCLPFPSSFDDAL
jgi:hypothetical protein